MKPCASPSYRKLRKDRQIAKSRKGVAAKARKRMEAPGEGWTHFEHVLRFAVSPDGRHVSLQMPSGWYRCGSERTIRSKLAKAIYNAAKETKTHTPQNAP